MAFRTRIRSVRFKDTGCEVRLLKSRVEDENTRTIAHLKEMVGYYATHYADMAGCVLIVWDHKGRNNVTVRIGDTSNIGTADLPTWAAERIRRYFNEHDARLVVKEMFGIHDENA